MAKVYDVTTRRLKERRNAKRGKKNAELGVGLAQPLLEGWGYWIVQKADSFEKNKQETQEREYSNTFALLVYFFLKLPMRTIFLFSKVVSLKEK